MSAQAENNIEEMQREVAILLFENGNFKIGEADALPHQISDGIEEWDFTKLANAAKWAQRVREGEELMTEACPTCIGDLRRYLNTLEFRDLRKACCKEPPGPRGLFKPCRRELGHSGPCAHEAGAPYVDARKLNSPMRKMQNKYEVPSKGISQKIEALARGLRAGFDDEDYDLEKEPQLPVEKVNHPKHYGGAHDPFETIKVLRVWLPRLPLRPYQAALMFNVIKYLSRAGLKGDLIEDLKKARWYLNELIGDADGYEEAKDTQLDVSPFLAVLANALSIAAKDRIPLRSAIATLDKIDRVQLLEAQEQAPFLSAFVGVIDNSVALLIGR